MLNFALFKHTLFFLEVNYVDLCLLWPAFYLRIKWKKTLLKSSFSICNWVNIAGSFPFLDVYSTPFQFVLSNDYHYTTISILLWISIKRTITRTYKIQYKYIRYFYYTNMACAKPFEEIKTIIMAFWWRSICSLALTQLFYIWCYVNTWYNKIIRLHNP